MSSASSFFTTLKSLITSPFAKDVSKTALRKSRRGAQTIFSNFAIFAGHLALSPIITPAGATVVIGSALTINHLQKTLRHQPSPPPLSTAAAVAGTAIGAALGTAVSISSGPVGALVAGSAGAALGTTGGRLIGNYISKTAVNLRANPLSRAVNLLPDLITQIGSHTFHSSKKLITISLIIPFIIIFLLNSTTWQNILSSFITPKQDATQYIIPAPKLNPAPPLPPIACFEFADDWPNETKALNTRNNLNQAINTLLNRFPNLTNLTCSVANTITLEYRPKQVELCAYVNGPIIMFRSFEDCTENISQPSFATYLFAHELGHIITQPSETAFFNAIGPEKPLSTYPNPKASWSEDFAESIGVYTRCKIFGHYCSGSPTSPREFNQSPRHMAFVEQYIGTIQ